MNPFELLRRDLERISRALGSGTLPATFNVTWRTFVVGYASVKEAPREKGAFIAEVELVELPRGIVGGVSLILRPEKRTARIEYTSVTDRRKGIGRALVQAVERDLKSRGYERIDLLAVTDSIPFWRRLGYRAAAEEVPGEALEMFKFL